MTVKIGSPGYDAMSPPARKISYSTKAFLYPSAILSKSSLLKVLGMLIAVNMQKGIEPKVAKSERALNIDLLAWIAISVPVGTCIPSIEESTLITKSAIFENNAQSSDSPRASFLPKVRGWSFFFYKTKLVFHIINTLNYTKINFYFDIYAKLYLILH